ncbi:MAG: hypothetical protein ACOC3A_03645 [Thermodesulfobacteriota bacterium]
MHYRLRYAVTIGILVSVLFLLPATSARAQDPFEEHKETTAGFMILDLLLVRPASLGATVIGSAVWLVALPFTAPAGETGYSLEKLIKEPAKYTFTRSLGFF